MDSKIIADEWRALSTANQRIEHILDIYICIVVYYKKNARGDERAIRKSKKKNEEEN